MNEFVKAVAEATGQGTFVRLVLSDPAGEHAVVRRVTVRPVVLKSGPCLQLAAAEERRETHRNLPVEAALEELTALFPGAFRQARLFRTDGDVTASANSRGSVRLSVETAQRAVPEAAHDRRKQYLIPDGVPCGFLAAIGVMTADGKVRARHHDKFRQINRFLEFVEDVYPSLPPEGVLRVVDFGCGRSSLTFALHHLLTRVHQRQVDIVGLDLKQDVIDHCRAVAGQLDCAGLRFEHGDIADYLPAGSVDLSVSLHACDTATDAAIAQAIRWQARVILAVPCCHHEFAAAMPSDLLPAIGQHGLLRERLAELATDAARAALLEAEGYRAQVLEFIDLEHTQRNVLIRAIRRAEDGWQSAQREEARVAYVAFKQSLGLGATALDRLLDAKRAPGAGA